MKNLYLTTFPTALLLLFSIIGNSASERTIANPRLTDWGIWGTWDVCPPYTFVTGMQLRTHPPQGVFKDDRGLTGIRLFCSHNEGDHSQSIQIQSSTDDVGKWGKVFFCSKFMTGFQMRSEPNRGILVDDTAANNMRIFCDGNQRGIFKEGDGTSFGKWTDKRTCGVNEAICGLITQIEKKSTWDKTGLNNVVMKCCDLPHPLGECKAETKWEYVATCENIAFPTVKKCSYSRHIGIGYADSLHRDTKVLFEKNGIGLLQMMTKFQSRLMNVSASEWEKIKQGVEKEEDINIFWHFAPSFVWQPEITFNSKVAAQSGTKVTLYQVKGKCGILHVWGTKLKRVEEDLATKKIKVNYLDITNDDGDSDYLNLI